MKAFVTGGTGLLGNNLVRALRAEGHAVAALVRSETKAQRLLGDTGAELIRGDMENVPAFADALTGCDVVFHTAAYFREYPAGNGEPSGRSLPLESGGTPPAMAGLWGRCPYE